LGDNFSPVPTAVIFYPEEFDQLRTAGPASLRLLWGNKRFFDPHGRTQTKHREDWRIGRGGPMASPDRHP
jgi:hypothetical protein